MPVFSRAASFLLRIGEIGFAAVVAGIIGDYLHHYNSSSGSPYGRWIYTEVIAALSMLLGLIWLLPFSSSFFHWPFDLVISAAWFAAFGILVNYLDGKNCGGVFNWHGIGIGNSGFCSKWKAAEAFAFLSAIFWLASVIVGIWFTSRVEHREVTHRRGWYRRHAV